jgi:TolA-binding protein
MAAKRLTRKEIKQEDRFLRTMKAGLRYAQEHRERLTLFLTIAAAAAVVVALISFSIRHSNRKANSVLRDGWTAFTRAKELAANPTVQDADAAAEDPETYLTQAIEAFEEVVDEYGSTKAAPQALFLLGNAYYDKGDYEQAIASFRKFLEEYPDHNLHTAARVALAYALEEKGEPAQALAEFEGILASEFDFYTKAELYLDIARTALESGNREKARDFYQRYLNEFPDGAQAELVNEKLEELEGGKSTA